MGMLWLRHTACLSMFHNEDLKRGEKGFQTDWRAWPKAAMV
jgi:hypothetical protein